MSNSKLPLILQVSGGRTSHFLARFCQAHFPNRELHFLYENTGKEVEGTLEFIDRCDKAFGWNVVWLEAVFYPDERKAPTHKVVNFETASRNGEPYERLIEKYGIQNMAYKDCTKYLKLLPKKSYLRSMGLLDYPTFTRLSESTRPKDKVKLAQFRGTYETAIGIRDDEKHRINRAVAAKENNIYPLVDLIKVNKQFILNWWSRQPFDLEIDEDFGNCDFCFKKTINQLVRQVQKQPEKLNWWEEMEERHGSVKAPLEPRKIFRDHTSAKELRELAKLPIQQICDHSDSEDVRPGDDRQLERFEPALF